MRIHVERGKEAPGGGRHVREEVPTDNIQVLPQFLT